MGNTNTIEILKLGEEMNHQKCSIAHFKTWKNEIQRTKLEKWNAYYPTSGDAEKDFNVWL